MPLHSEDIVSLLNGVSQQPAALRHPSQCEAMVNCLPDVADGVRRRPPAVHIKRIRTDPLVEDPFIHLINRDTSERYEVVIENGDLKVYDLAGIEKTVNFPDGKVYLGAADPRSSFKAVTVADYTFIVNTTVTVALSATVSPGTLTGSAQTFGALPAGAAGNIYKIYGDDSTNFGEYYVEKDPGGGAFWTEHFMPGLLYAWEQSTMPHILVNSGGTFTFSRATWLARETGDNVSAKAPSFYGKKIQDVFFHHNRIGFTAGENYILSRVGNAPGGYFSFWPETVQAVLDSDPIDKAAPHERVSLLEQAVSFNKQLFMFSRETQFVLGPDDSLTPETAKADPVTEFNCRTEARPVASGGNLYFAVDNGDNDGVREYFVNEDTATNDAADITSHVPKFIPSGVFKLAGSTNRNILLALSEGGRNRVYVYNYYWIGDEKAQSAWSYWELEDDDDILSADFVGATIWLIVRRADGLHLEKIELNSDASKDAIGTTIYLDSRIEVTGVYDSGTDVTTWTLPYDLKANEAFRVVLGAAFTGQVGKVVSATRATATTLTATGDFSAGIAYIGRRREQSMTFSELFVSKPKQNGGRSTVVEGRLQVLNMTVQHDETGYYRAEVTLPNGSTYTYPFTGKLLGNESAKMGTIGEPSGRFRFPVGGRSTNSTIKLANDSHLGATWLSATWLGRFSPQAVP